jgi:tRNA (guanine-N7-)-methyltransferase
LLDLLARAMAPGAELRIATDIGDYARTILLAAGGHPALVWQAEGPQDWRERAADWPQTRYEVKARRDARRCYFFRFLKARRSRHNVLARGVTMP